MAPTDRTRSAATSLASPAGRRAHEHVFEVYETEKFLADTVTGFVGAGLHAGGAAIVVATPAHRCAFEGALRASGIDVVHAVNADRYLALDAAELLGRLVVDRVPDRRRFGELVGAVLERAGAGSRRVRVYGEMVALLWAAGQTDSAIALEGFWNELAETHEFELLCAYPLSAFKDVTRAPSRPTTPPAATSTSCASSDGDDRRRRRRARRRGAWSA